MLKIRPTPFVAAACVLASSVGWALPVETAGSHRGIPWRVETAPHGAGVILAGEVRRSVLSAGRRPRGRVRVELLDAAGAAVVTYHATLQPRTLGRHTQRASFRVEVPELPGAATRVRVTY